MREKSLSGFGMAVDGVDLVRADERIMRDLIGLLFEHRYLAIVGQSLDNAAYVRFGRQWGDPIVHVRDDVRRSEFPELITIANEPSKPPHMRDLAVHWHADSSYESVPASVTMLYCLEAPKQGGETLFADLVAAYEALPAATRARIDGLKVRHYWYGGIAALNTAGENPNAVPLTDALKAKLDVVFHPLVRRHPATGRAGLYAISGTPCGIEGMADADAMALLAELKAHALRPEFRASYTARAGDVLLWDNNATLHSATPIEYSDAPGKRRRLLRISTKGLPALLRAAAA